MKDFVLVLGSAITTPPHQHRYHRQRLLRPKSRRNPESSPSVATHARSTPPVSSSPASISSVCSRPLGVCDVQWNSATSLEHCAEVASKLAEEGRLDAFAETVEQVAVSGADLSRFETVLSAEFVAKGIAMNLRKGNMDGVVKAMSRVGKLGIVPAKLFDESVTKLLRKHIREMVASRRLEEVVDLMEALAGFHIKIRELADPFVIVKACIDNCSPNTVIRYAGLLPHAEILFCRIISEYGKKRDMISVLEAFEACKRNLDTRNMYIYRTLIDVCGLCGDYMKSRYIYEDILKQNITPNIYVLNSLMNVNSHDLGYTLDLYKNMQKLDIPADMASYNILLKACCLAGRVDLAQDIYKEAKRLESAGGLKLDAFTYCTIIKVFADARLWKMALKVKEDMQSAGVTPNTFTWSALISACANAGLVEQSIQLFKEMLQAGCEPNSQCFNILLHACVEARQYDRAFRLFQSWQGGRVQENLSKDYSNSQNVHSISEQINKNDCNSKQSSGSPSPQMPLPKRFFKPTTATYNILLKACGTDFCRAKALLDEMKSLGLLPNHISWSTLINICGSSGNLESAFQILRTMHAAGTKPDVVAYTAAIKVCVESKNLKVAFSLFEEMRRYQIKPNLVTYNTLLRARSRYGSLHEVRQCLKVYQDMRKQGYKPNDYYLKELIEEWCEGVIQENNLNQDEPFPETKTNLGRPQSLLIEKVAAHLQKRAAENLVIDLQGLTKVEARIVILAVLRMIKENYIQGDEVKDDMVIILGKGWIDPDIAKHEIGMKDSVIELLQGELGLQVISVGSKSTRKTDLGPQNGHDFDPKPESTSNPKDSVIESTRRPVILQRLKVPKKSLHCWLQRRALDPRI